MASELFEECTKLLGTQVTVLSAKESNHMSGIFEKMYPLTEWGKIDWDKIDMNINIGNDPAQIIPSLNRLFKHSFDKSVYVEWSEMGIPVIQTNLDSIVQFFDDIMCLAFEKFIFNPNEGYIVEVRHLGEITVGVIPIHQS